MVFFSLLNTYIAKSFKVCNDKPVIDDYPFKCHYKLTTNILLMFSILLTSINLIGSPMECITNSLKKDVDVQKVINTYCLMSSSFTHQNKPVFHQFDVEGIEENIKFHSYYQWVPFMLFFQAIIFYVPHWMWKTWEGGKIRMITKDMRGCHMSTLKNRRAQQNKLVQYFVESIHSHSTYAFGYILSEIINLINVSANIYITNKFLGGSFLTYGIDVFKYHQNYEHRFNPMEVVFPRLTKCNFYKYGPSGTIQNLDAMCILAQNVLNEKIYLVLWIWFFILVIISVFALIYRLTLIAQMMMKTTMLFNMFKFTNNKGTISSLVAKFQVGDFLLLHFIEKNVNTIQFKEIMDEICSCLNMKNHNELLTSSENFNPHV